MTIASHRPCVVATCFVLMCVSGCQPPAPSASSPDSSDRAHSVPDPTSNPIVEEPAASDAEPALPVTEPLRVLSDTELAEGWIALFDGKTLFGWTPVTDANWRVEDESIMVDAGERGLLCTTTQFSDYVLRADFRSAVDTNSGIFLHAPLTPQDPATDCYELNIAGSDNPFPTGSLVKRLKAEGNHDSEDWQSFEITVVGGQVTIQLDGAEVLNYTDPAPLRHGHIGLQFNQGHVAFRNIKLKPLGTASLFNGQDLAGWKTYPDMASKFSVTDEGYLHVQDGRGQLETEKSYGDFVLQIECLTHAPQLNSGFFFRCIPGELMNGYESQIHNGFKDGDRRKPVDCGTGGIFRRIDARLVVANDLEWFSKTVIANGPHIATWVNGYQVVNWTDTRQPHENPRQGRRVEPGTIMIQGHDPTTKISFRNLRIAELAPRRDDSTATTNE